MFRKEDYASSLKLFRVGEILLIQRPQKDDFHSLVIQGQYDYADNSLGDITLQPVIGNRAHIELVSFKGKLETRHVVLALNEAGRLAAPLEALLMLGSQHKMVQRGWHVTSMFKGPNLIHLYPPNLNPTKDTANYWCPSVVCLASPVKTRVRDYEVAMGLTYDDAFSKGRNLVAFQYDREWRSEDFCFPRIVAEAA